MGGRLVLEHAAAHPEEVAAIACVSARPDRPAPAFEARLLAVAERARREGVASIMDFWFDPSDPLAEEATAISTANPAEGTAAAIECSARADTFTRLAEIEAPALVVVGDRDEAFFAAARLLVDGLPEAELRILEGVGHFPNLQTPELLAELLRDHFSKPLH